MNEYSADTTEYQVGAHDINENTSLEGGESIQFDFENAAIFKRLADDIYESPEAGIREPLQNSLTAIKRAIMNGSLHPSEGVVEIEVTDGDQVGLVLRDNGIGISKNVLDKVLTVIGRSQNRDNGTVSGKYGMGFLACYKLVGVDGGFIMYTNSREKNTSPLTGIWKPGIFELDKDNRLPQMLDGDDYGTRFDFTLREEIDIKDIREWVEKHSKWATIPIIYREFNSDNELKYDDEFGIKELSDEHNGSNFRVDIDNDDFTAICSKKQDGRTLLINSPIGRNSSYDSDISSWKTIHPSNMDIRLKNENGIVIKGPHKGLMPVSEAEYENMGEERKSNYISEKELNLPSSAHDVMDSNIDITLPQPTGTRDTLERNSYFWSYLHKKMVNIATEKLKSYLLKVDEPEGFFNLPQKEQKYIISAMSILSIDRSSVHDIKTDFKNEFSINLSDDLARFYTGLYTKVYHISRNSSTSEASKKEGDGVSKELIGNIITELGDSGRAFMGVSMKNQTKMNAVWEDDINNAVIRVDKSNIYDKYDELYGWKQLRYVKKYIDIDSLSDYTKHSLENKTTNTSSSVKDKDIKNRELTIHTNSSNSKNQKLHSVKSAYDEPSSEKLVLFLSNSDYNVSDYYDIVSKDVSVSNSLVKMWDYLNESQNITTIENWMEYVKNIQFETSDGTYTGKEISEYTNNIVFHVTNEHTELFQRKDIMNKMKNIHKSSKLQDSSYITDDSNLYENPTLYVPITSTKLNYLRILFNDIDSRDNIVITINSKDKTRLGLYTSLSNSDLYWYAWSCLTKWRDTKQINMFTSSSYNITDEWVRLIDTMAKKNADVQEYDFPSLYDETTYKTSDGVKSLSEIQEEYEIIIVHVLKQNISKLFKKDDVIKGLKKYVYENEFPINSRFKNRSTNKEVREIYDIDDVAYIPITKGEMKDLKRIYKDNDKLNMCIVSSKKIYRSRDSKIDNDTSAYASAVLPEDIASVVIPDNKNSMKKLSRGGLELIDTMAELN
jgi:hypothetical protein